MDRSVDISDAHAFMRGEFDEAVRARKLEPLPPRMTSLSIDRGYPVPWFVAWVDGKPEFRAMDGAKFVRAIKEKLCWVCGNKLGVHVVFTAGPMALTRNPGVTMLWITRQFEIFNDGAGKPLIQMGEPEEVEWWAEGKPATREQVQASIDSGLPNLEAVARTEKGGIEALRKYVTRFEKWLPKEEMV